MNWSIDSRTFATIGGKTTRGCQCRPLLLLCYVRQHAILKINFTLNVEGVEKHAIPLQHILVSIFIDIIKQEPGHGLQNISTMHEKILGADTFQAFTESRLLQVRYRPLLIIAISSS
ncbi:hypothetical protein ACOSQ4_018802 [Xanthoceras sorbifolium]